MTFTCLHRATLIIKMVLRIIRPQCLEDNIERIKWNKLCQKHRTNFWNFEITVWEIDTLCMILIWWRHDFHEQTSRDIRNWDCNRWNTEWYLGNECFNEILFLFDSFSSYFLISKACSCSSSSSCYWSCSFSCLPFH